jgi:hypothetical protein
MKKKAPTLAALISMPLLAVLFIPSRAAAQDFDDPPSRVARLSYTQGAVSFQPAGTDDWVDATVNRPLTTGDQLWSDSGSRAALHIGSASIHLSEYTGFSFLNLTDTTAQLQLSSGTLRIRVKRLGDAENFEVDTPNLAFSILRPGIYKISVNAAGNTTVIEDRRGQGEVTGGGSAFTLNAGDVGTFSGTYALNADVEGLGDGEDDFERWSQQRDHHEDISISARYVSDDAIGYDDLDDNGGWRSTPGYGMVWFPHTATVGWAPYHNGHWAYVAPWGYTWVDDASWGFAPFHYGRWVSAGGAWGWVPCPPRPAVIVGGAVYVRPVFAPALVAWIGGPHFGIGISVGAVGVGWFPLGPREVYMPSYPVSRSYANNVNISNTTVNTTVVNNYYTNVVVNKNVNITNVTYVNQRVPGAVVATTPQAFSSGQSVSKNVVRVNASEVASAPVNALTPPAVPQRAAVLGGRAAASVKPSAAIQARAVVAKTAPPPPPPSFAKRQAAIQSNGGRPLSVAQVHQIAPVRAQTAAAPQIKVAPPATKVVPPRNVQATKAAQPPNQNAPNRAVPVQTPANAAKPVEKPAGQPVANDAQHPLNRPVPAQTPTNAAAKQVEKPATKPLANDAQHPPTAHPVNEQLEQKHEQQNVDLHKQQDQERQQVELQQQKENQLLQKQKADAAKQQQIVQQQQQQLQVLQQKHQQQQQQLQQKQEAEHKQAEKQPPPKDKASKPKDEKSKDEKPH